MTLDDDPTQRVVRVIEPAVKKEPIRPHVLLARGVFQNGLLVKLVRGEYVPSDGAMGYYGDQYYENYRDSARRLIQRMRSYGWGIELVYLARPPHKDGELVDRLKVPSGECYHVVYPGLLSYREEGGE